MAASKSKRLTEKQEAFTVSFFHLGNASEAYRQSYDVESNARDGWIYVEACKLLDNPKVALRLQELRDQAEKLSIFTRKKALEELEEARSLAHGEGQASAAVSAVTAKIKLCGYDQPSKIEITGKDGGPVEFEQRPSERIASRLASLASAKRTSEDT